VQGEGYRFDGLTKSFAADEKPSIAAPAIPADELRMEREPQSPAPSERGPEREVAGAGMKPAEATEVSEPALAVAAEPAGPQSRPELVGLASAVAAVLMLAAAVSWLVFGGHLTRPAQPPHLSIVVLPFANLSGDPAQDYFADGITDNLTTELSRIRDSFVIARNTAFTYKGKSIDAKEIGTELGVRYVLEGSVQRDQNRVRLNVQLVDAESGAHIWADRFDDDVVDLFKLQDEVVTRLADSLNLALTKAEAEKGARSKNPDIIDLTMRGTDSLLRAFHKPPEEMRHGIHQARTFFERALQIDPNDAKALAGNAQTYADDFFFGWGDHAIDYEAKALGQANRALAIDPNNSAAYYAKADYLSLSHRPSEALGVTDAGLAVNPNNVMLYTPRATAENGLGRYEQAKADAERAIRLSPHDFDVGIWHVIVGDAEINLGHFDAAIAEYRKALDLGWQQAFFVHTNLTAAYAHAGKMDDAKDELAEARRLNPAITIKWMKEHTPNLPAVFDGLRKAGLPEE
jgi:TolB-like protein